MEELGTVNAAGSDVKENRPDSRPIYSFVKEEEDWLVEMKKPRSKVKSDEPLENVKTIRVLYLQELIESVE